MAGVRHWRSRGVEVGEIDCRVVVVNGEGCAVM